MLEPMVAYIVSSCWQKANLQKTRPCVELLVVVVALARTAGAPHPHRHVAAQWASKITGARQANL
jgi:hypothetical protein